MSIRLSNSAALKAEPDDGDMRWELTFADGKHTSKKQVHLRNNTSAVINGNPVAKWKELLYLVNKALVEAERDMLFNQYGKDWQKHDKLRLRVWGARTKPHPALMDVMDTFKKQQTK